MIDGHPYRIPQPTQTIQSRTLNLLQSGPNKTEKDKQQQMEITHLLGLIITQILDGGTRAATRD